jgi:hypothetical protein
LSNTLAIGGTTTLNYASMRIQGISKIKLNINEQPSNFSSFTAQEANLYYY